MKTLALIALMMVLGLSGCACFGTSGPTKEDWASYWRDPGGERWESIKKDWVAYWKDPTDEEWESIKQDWAAYWRNPGGERWESIKKDWAAYWNCFE